MIDLLATHAAELVTCRTGPRGLVGPALHGMVINRFGVDLVETVVKDGRTAWRARA